MRDIKNFILGNDGSDKEPVDFKTELKKAIDSGLLSKSDGTLLITARTNCDKLAELISKSEEKEVIKSSKEKDEKENYFDEELESNKEKKKKEEERIEKVHKQSLEQQIQESQNAMKNKIESENNYKKSKENERK